MGSATQRRPTFANPCGGTSQSLLHAKYYTQPKILSNFEILKSFISSTVNRIKDPLSLLASP
jgi:hypothetical protein